MKEEVNTMLISEHEEIMQKLKNEFEERLKQELQKITENNKEKYESEILNVKVKAIEQINNSKKTLESSFYNKERKMITSVCKDLQFYLEIFIKQLQIRFENDTELPHMIALLYENLNTLYEDLNIQILNTQIGDIFKADIHNILSIVETNKAELNDTIAEVIKQGFQYNNQTIVSSTVNIYKFK